MYIDPHVHMVSRTTDDYQRMALAGCVAITEPAFWAGYDRSSPQGFYDYFRQLTDFEPKRAAQYGIRHHRFVQGANQGCINHSRLPSSQNFQHLAHRDRIRNRSGNSRSHDLALEGPIIQILKIPPQNPQDQFHPQVLQNRQIQQCFGKRRLRQKPCLNQYEKHLSPKLGDILQNFSHVTGLRHNAFLANQANPASARLPTIALAPLADHA